MADKTDPAAGQPDWHERYERLHGPDWDAACREAGELAARGDVIIVSACLLGEKVRYDGADKLDAAVLARVRARAVLPLCPEILAGLGCPRPAIHFATGDGEDVLCGTGRAHDALGRDVTTLLQRGALRAAELARRAGARCAILKERSPSCGLAQVHGSDGVVAGRGCFAAALGRDGVVAESEEKTARDAVQP